MAYDAKDPKDVALVETMIDEATAGLKTKNAELLTKLAEAKKASPADVAGIQSKLDAVETELETTKTELKKTTRKYTALETELEGEKKFSNSTLVDREFNDALGAANIRPEFQTAVRAMLAPKAEVQVDGDKRKVVADGKPLGDFVKAWALGDQGKAFIAASVNTGGGSGGGQGKPNAKSMTRSAYDALPQADRAAAMKDGATITDG